MMQLEGEKKEEMETNKIILGDCIKEMKKLPDNSIDAIITDPPYGLEFMGKDWDKFKEGHNIAGGDTGKDTPYARSKPTPSFYQMSKKRFGIKGEEGENDLKVKKDFNVLPRFFQSDMHTFQTFSYNWAKECLRVIKPGGYLLSFGGPRTYHRMVCGVEDAGFEIRDCILWVHGQGFPKSLNIGKAVDKLQGNEREIIGKQNYSMPKADNSIQSNSYGISGGSLKNGVTAERIVPDITKGNSEWEGWGTALKPAVEPIVLARKPLSEKNVALNVLKWGTGGLNIDECRVNFVSKEDEFESKNKNQHSKYPNSIMRNPAPNGIYHQDKREPEDYNATGRFPANLIHDGSDEVVELFPNTGKSQGGRAGHTGAYSGGYKQEYYDGIKPGFGDSGSASRFFYCAKASKSERNFGLENTNIPEKPISINEPHNPKNSHPTVKPTALLEYLIKLVTKEGYVVLDPFLGSGTTAIACLKLNRKFIGIEKEEEYVKIAEARIKPFLEQKKL